LIDTRSAHRDLLINNVAMRSALAAAPLVGLCINNANDAEFDL